ncbi:MAG: hypothetical protein ACYTFW_21415 [Planctomycetota bacterium]
MRDFKRILVISDLHCGHRVGLTMPDYWSKLPAEKYYYIQSQLWEAFAEFVESLQPIDILFVNGDCTDGKGSKSGATELIQTSLFKQGEMAAEVIKWIAAEKVVMTYGTPYHVGTEDDIESQIAKDVGAVKIGAQVWPEVNGVVFDLKHQAESGSSIPHGKGTPLSKERLWNLLWAEHDAQPKSDILIRSHCHYAFDCGEPHWHAFFTPALQGAGTKYGGRRRSGIVHFGVLHIDVQNKGENVQDKVSWAYHTLFVESQKSKVLSL